jgi:hypothetical protein
VHRSTTSEKKTVGKSKVFEPTHELVCVSLHSVNLSTVELVLQN